jgi:hypothetical protein
VTPPETHNHLQFSILQLQARSDERCWLSAGGIRSMLLWSIATPAWSTHNASCRRVFVFGGEGGNWMSERNPLRFQFRFATEHQLRSLSKFKGDSESQVLVLNGAEFCRPAQQLCLNCSSARVLRGCCDGCRSAEQQGHFLIG